MRFYHISDHDANCFSTAKVFKNICIRSHTHATCCTCWLSLTVLVSLPSQRTAGGNTSETPAARPYTPTQLTSWCPGSSAPPCPSQEAYMPSRSPVADPALRTTSGQNPTRYPRTPCTTTLTSTPPPMNTTWGRRPGRRLTLYPVSEDTRTTTTWTRPRLTCTQPPAAPLTMTMGPDNDCCPPGLTAHSTVGMEKKKRAGEATQPCLLAAHTGCVTCVRLQPETPPCWINPAVFIERKRIGAGQCGHLRQALRKVWFDLWTPKATAQHQGTPSYLSSADIEPANRGGTSP